MNSADLSRVYVVDDDLPVLESLSALIGCLGVDVDCHASPRNFLAAVDASRPSCVVTDLRMPGMNGIEVQATLASRCLHFPLIVLTGHGDVPAAVNAMKRGAINFLEKPCAPDVLISSVREALELARQRFGGWRQRSDFARKIEHLTEDERQVLAELVRGRSNRQMAVSMDVSPRTVQFRRSRMLTKLGVASRAELMDVVLKAGWTPESGAASTAENGAA